MGNSSVDLRSVEVQEEKSECRGEIENFKVKNQRQSYAIFFDSKLFFKCKFLRDNFQTIQVTFQFQLISGSPAQKFAFGFAGFLPQSQFSSTSIIATHDRKNLFAPRDELLIIIGNSIACRKVSDAILAELQLI
jgi:hypothetical protein